MPTVKAENIKQLLNNELDSVRNLKPTPKKLKPNSKFLWLIAPRHLFLNMFQNPSITNTSLTCGSPVRI